ncbi:MAG: phosphatase PAP2 family protein [Clostridia bacterium]|nr:phosphatase PAP2 family protein [Clostridia bacterium]
MEQKEKISFEKSSIKRKVKSIWDKIKYGIVPFLFLAAANLISWAGNQLFGAIHGAQPNIAIDANIPFVSWFIVFYFVCFPVAVVALFVAFAKNKKRGYDIAFTVTIALLISGLIYLLWPTEFPLEWKYSWLPENMNFFDRWTYSLWHTGKPTCLLPSQHCYFAIACIISVVDSDNMSWWYRVFMIVFNICVLLSTFFLKQHFVLDFVASLAIMTIIYLILRLCKFGDKMDDWVTKREVIKQNKKSTK